MTPTSKGTIILGGGSTFFLRKVVHRPKEAQRPTSEVGISIFSSLFRSLEPSAFSTCGCGGRRLRFPSSAFCQFQLASPTQVLRNQNLASSGRRRIPKNGTRERSPGQFASAECSIPIPWRARRRRCRSRCCRRRSRAPTAPAPSPTASPPTTRGRPLLSRSSGLTSSSTPSRPSSTPFVLSSIRSPFLSVLPAVPAHPVLRWLFAGSALRTTPPYPMRRRKRPSSRRGVCLQLSLLDYCSFCSIRTC